MGMFARLRRLCDYKKEVKPIKKDVPKVNSASDKMGLIEYVEWSDYTELPFKKNKPQNKKDYFGPPRIKFIAKPNTWFDEGTIVTLVDDYSDICYDWTCGECGKACGMALFEGLKNNKIDREVCNFCEFKEYNDPTRV
jgi:hypothetical protein